MKQILLFLLFFQCISIFCQDWQISHSGRTRFYDKGTKALRVDSTFYQNGDSILKFYNCMTRFSSNINGVYEEFLDYTGPTFFGSQLTIKPNGDQELYFEHYDTLFFPQNIQLNDSWTIKTDDLGNSTTAELIQVDTVHAFDYIDSVRVIKLNSNQIIKISKNNGLYSTEFYVDFSFGISQPHHKLITSPDVRPLIKEIYQNVNIGDKFGFNWDMSINAYGNILDEYQGIDNSADSITFYYKNSRQVNAQGGPFLYCYCMSFTINNINDSLFYSLPNEYPIKIKEQSVLNRMIGMKNTYSTLMISQDSIPIFSYFETTADSFSNYVLFEPLAYEYQFSEIFGGYVSVEVQSPQLWDAYNLIYYDKGAQIFGSPFTIPVSCPNCFTNISPSSNSNFSLYPNPSTTSFTIESPSKISKIEIYNLLGSLILVQNIDNKNFMDIRWYPF